MIGFDIDGVIANFHDIFREVVLDETGVDIDELDNTRFEIKIPGLNKQDVGALVNKTINRFVFEMQPYPGAVEALWKLYDRTREPIQFVTARKQITKESTERWLKEYVVVPHVLHSGIQSAQKAVYLERFKFTHFIDDRFRTVKEVVKHVPYTYLMSRPWNEGREAEGVYRVYNLDEYVNDYLRWRENQRWLTQSS